MIRIRVNQYCKINGYADATAIFKVIVRHKEYGIPVFSVELVSSDTQKSGKQIRMDGSYLIPTTKEGEEK